jgi:hypothetical protein
MFFIILRPDEIENGEAFHLKEMFYSEPHGQHSRTIAEEKQLSNLCSLSNIITVVINLQVGQ